jgi:WD40 repeat protein
MKYKKKIHVKKKDDKLKPKPRKEIKPKIKNIKKAKKILPKKAIKKEIDIKNKNNLTENEDKSKENNIDNTINLQKITSFPLEFYFSKDLIKENLGLCSMFIIFKSINDILTLVYITDDYSIVTYDIVQNKQLNIIKNSQKDICNLQHCLDKKNKRDLILSQSCNNNIKIWDINNYKCILNLKEMELNYVQVSQVCLMNYKNNIYIIMSSTSFSDPICKIFDLSGNIIKKINFELMMINNIIKYDDEELSKFYIIISSPKMIKSYNYDEDKIYHCYLNLRNSCIYNLVVVNKDRIWEPTRLFGNYGNYVIIWNFHTGEMLNNVFSYVNINNICLWNNQFLIAITENFKENKSIISLLDVNTGQLKKDLISNEKCKFVMISKIDHPEYGEGLIALTEDHVIKLFLTKVSNSGFGSGFGSDFGFDFITYLADLVYNKVKH